MSKNIEKLLKRAKKLVSKMSAKEYADMMEEQKKSFVRGMMSRCAHGKLDFEQCMKCRAERDSDD